MAIPNRGSRYHLPPFRTDNGEGLESIDTYIPHALLCGKHLSPDEPIFLLTLSPSAHHSNPLLHRASFTHHSSSFLHRASFTTCCCLWKLFFGISEMSLIQSEVIFSYPSQCFPSLGQVYRFNEAVYRLRKAPKLWMATFTQALHKASFSLIAETPLKDNVSFPVALFFYVDDFFIMGCKENPPQSTPAPDVHIQDERVGTTHMVPRNPHFVGHIHENDCSLTTVVHHRDCGSLFCKSHSTHEL
ncbi:hypothetical protein EJ06DRAFT_530064 [Trichodelitschia bisporula]|uniref:Reverse transcriptase Ty1/copia-type domain-containing protein n=1 Tax=Trichodelitschia bisporula TaxID=703511 RepID=A0A6G1HYJ3_9PEZI|nr:hypothetical protein EJ06DRAFT_530064 [Trichodelitschia bisporula]